MTSALPWSRATADRQVSRTSVLGVARPDLAISSPYNLAIAPQSSAFRQRQPEFLGDGLRAVELQSDPVRRNINDGAIPMRCSLDRGYVRNARDWLPRMFSLLLHYPRSLPGCPMSAEVT
jgi:hypothetical protein